jgi:GNAT superfamily N-acetyltransferase
MPPDIRPAPKSVPILRLASIGEIISLRSLILRPSRPIADSRYPGDDASGTFHAGAFDGSACVGCATFLHEGLDGQDAYRLRGMAVHPAYQRMGVGRSMLQFLTHKIADRHVGFIWCNARAPAMPFYKRLGWHIYGEPFDIPEAGGLHYRMRYFLNG